MDEKEVWICWDAVKDFTSEPRPEHQKLAFEVMCAIISNHYSLLDNLRNVFFQTIQVHHNQLSEATLDALILLTQNGRAVPPFERDIWNLILDWLSNPQAKLLPFTDQVIKSNATLIDEYVLIGIIHRICNISNNAKIIETMEQCLTSFETIILYVPHIPSSCFTCLISSLCRLVNIEKLSEPCWKIFHHLLQGHSSWHGIKSLCSILDDPGNEPAYNLLRGAVFFINQSLWGSKKIAGLEVSNVSLLPSLLRVIGMKQHYIVAYEVSLGLRRLVLRFGKELNLEWHIIFKMLENLKPYLLVKEDNRVKSVVGQILDFLEENCVSDSELVCDRKELSRILELYVQFRPPDKTIFILQKKLEYITPANVGWLEDLKTMMTTFFVREERTKVRKEALHIAKQIFDKYKHLYGSEIVDAVFLTFLPSIYLDLDEVIRLNGIQCIKNIAKDIVTSQFREIVEILVRASSQSEPGVLLSVRREAVTCLISIFEDRFPKRYVDQTIYLFRSLMKLAHDDDFVIRRNVITQMLQVRSNPHYQLQMYNKINPLVRTYASHPSSTAFPTQELFSVLTESLKKEDRFELFTAIVHGIKNFIQNQWIMKGIATSKLTSLLCRLLEQKIFGVNLEKPSFEISEEQKLENLHIGYELLVLLIPFFNGESLVGDEIASCLYAGLSFSRRDTTVICLNGLSLCHLYVPGITKYLPRIIKWIFTFIQKSRPSGAKSIYIVEYLLFLAQFPKIIRNSLNTTDIKQILDSLLLLTEFTHIHMALIYRTLSLWFLQIPPKIRPEYFPAIKASLENAHYGHSGSTSSPLRDSNNNQSKNNLLAESTLDLLTRYTYTDCEAMNAPETTDSVFFNKTSKTEYYMQGTSIMSITTGMMGWVKVTVRRATGTVEWVMQLRNKLRSFNPDYLNDELVKLIEYEKSVKQNIENLEHLGERASTEEKVVLPELPDLDSSAEDLSQIIDDKTNITIMNNDDRIEDQMKIRPYYFTRSVSNDKIENKSEYRITDLPNYYPPLPSYDEKEDDSHMNYVGKGKLSPEAQLYLHDPSVIAEFQNFSDSILIPEGKNIGIDLKIIPIQYPEKEDLFQMESPMVNTDEKLVSLTEISKRSYSRDFNSDLENMPIQTQQPQNQSQPQNQQPQTQNQTQTQQPQVQNQASQKQKVMDMEEMVVPKRISLKNKTDDETKKVKDRLTSSTEIELVYSADKKKESIAELSCDDATVIHPSFVHLQLQLIPFNGAKAKLLENTEGLSRAITLLDRILSVETHKIGVLYIAPGQTKEEEILANTCGSPRYTNFLRNLGKMVRLSECSADIYTAGLDKTPQASDGEFSILWQNEVSQIMFHVATLMPSGNQDRLTSKKSHIGNDHVNIVYNESDSPYNRDTLKGQFSNVIIVINPLETNFCKVSIQRKLDVDLTPGPIMDEHIITENHLSQFVRQTALNYDLATKFTLMKQIEYSANCEARLSQLKHIADRFLGNEEKPILRHSSKK
uniref:Rap-GAP domain-containing protein n=1 Tax=Arcella intermedia TaxID=1963864 RepID=A0A6B2KWK7_9EUKA